MDKICDSIAMGHALPTSTELQWILDAPEGIFERFTKDDGSLGARLTEKGIRLLCVEETRSPAKVEEILPLKVQEACSADYRALRMDWVVEAAANSLILLLGCITHGDLGPLSVEHASMMLWSIVCGEVKGDKAHRWLGWAQAVICFRGGANLEHLKSINQDAKDMVGFTAGEDQSESSATSEIAKSSAFYASAEPCRGCGAPLLLENAWMFDGCPCNTPAGVNDGNLYRWRLLGELQQKGEHQRSKAEALLAQREAELAQQVKIISPLTEGEKEKP